MLLTDELTEFNFAQNGVSWSIAADFDTYELPYRTLPIDQWKMPTPITIKTEDGVCKYSRGGIGRFSGDDVGKKGQHGV